jgi:hypothetical protein
VDLFTRADLQSLLVEMNAPCVSLYMPAHRGGAEQDPVQFRQLLRRTEDCLKREGLVPLVEHHFEEGQRKALGLYRQLVGTGRTSADLREIVPTAYRGEIETFFASPGRPRWGRFDPEIGMVQEHDSEGPGSEDLLNVAAVHTLLHGHKVFAPSPAEMPRGVPAAAIFCLPLAKHGKRP